MNIKPTFEKIDKTRTKTQEQTQTHTAKNIQNFSLPLHLLYQIIIKLTFESVDKAQTLTQKKQSETETEKKKK